MPRTCVRIAMRAALATVAVLMPPLVAEAAEGRAIAFVHVSVVDVSARTPAAALKRDQTVIVTGRTIEAVGEAARVVVPTGAIVVEAAGRYLIPGLTDMHVHTLIEGRPEFAFPMFVANGVTGVRDMGGSFSADVVRRMRDDIEAGRMIGPHLLAVPGKILDGPSPGERVAFTTVASAAEGRRLVAAAKAEGRDFVKAYNLLSRESYLAIVAEAKGQHLPVAGHVPFALTAKEVSDIGQRTIEHAADFPISCSSQEEALRKRVSSEGATAANSNWARARVEIEASRTYDAAKASALFATFARNGTWQCPTLVLKEMSAAARLEDLSGDPRLASIPASMRQRWMETFRDLVAPIGQPAERRLRADRTVEIVGAMHRAGVRLLAGTDSPPQPFLFPGFALHDELALFVRAGLTPLEALRTATADAAEFLGRSRSAGTVAAGRSADLVLLGANPLEDIRNTRTIQAVVLGGRYLDRSALDALLARTKTAAGE
jgi:imidazolonepropionase-like amidohydrolase